MSQVSGSINKKDYGKYEDIKESGNKLGHPMNHPSHTGRPFFNGSRTRCRNPIIRRTQEQVTHSLSQVRMPLIPHSEGQVRLVWISRCTHAPLWLGDKGPRQTYTGNRPYEPP